MLHPRGYHLTCSVCASVDDADNTVAHNTVARATIPGPFSDEGIFIQNLIAIPLTALFVGWAWYVPAVVQRIRKDCMLPTHCCSTAQHNQQRARYINPRTRRRMRRQRFKRDTRVYLYTPEYGCPRAVLYTGPTFSNSCGMHIFHNGVLLAGTFMTRQRVTTENQRVRQDTLRPCFTRICSRGHAGSQVHR